MKKVKITILKTMLNEDLAKEYGICGLKACPMMKVGDVFYADCAKPDGFCDEAWKGIYQYAFALSHGVSNLFDGDWVKEPGVAIVSCNDGLRPVIMKLEATDENIYPLER
ncbi:TIGR04076 family protein [Prevotella nigrescens]|jgi:TIGR04076 family protein|uniref:TIGR04076 family protein n=1 Tax=Prevotella nigrescens TaxID=28133 RepID=UPI00352CCCB1